MTQIEAAKSGKITKEMRQVAESEGISPDVIRSRIAAGEIVIPKNKNHHLDSAIGVGTGLRTKINANVGSSPDRADPANEIEKARVAADAGSDAVMDLSTGGDIEAIRNGIIDQVPVVIGTVPVYESAIRAIEKRGALVRMTVDDIFDVLEKQAVEGVDFFTIHAGVTQDAIRRLKAQGRVTDIVSRGGSFLTTWMLANNQENPFFEHFDRILDIARTHDITLSLGDGLRPGSLSDATDRAQIQELITLGELARRCREHDVQVIIEGPGHVPLNEIQMNIQIQKKLCNNAPFYVLGPIVTDVAPGYDHITSAIGGAIAAWAGADFLCYVTPGEHLKLPDAEDVRLGVIASRIAAHAADIAKGVPGAMKWDIEMSQARKALDWERQIKLSLDPERAGKLRRQGKPLDEDGCTMCGEYCAIRLVEEALAQK